MDKQKLSLGILAAVAGLTVFLLAALALKQKQVSPGRFPLKQTGSLPTSSPPLPTKTPEELEIISKIETKKVIIKNNKFDPQTITVKPHDQVVWENQDGVNHNVKGENWGNILLGPNERFTQAFDKPGVYSYICSLHPTMTGTVIVK